MGFFRRSKNNNNNNKPIITKSKKKKNISSSSIKNVEPIYITKITVTERTNSDVLPFGDKIIRRNVRDVLINEANKNQEHDPLKYQQEKQPQPSSHSMKEQHQQQRIDDHQTAVRHVSRLTERTMERTSLDGKSSTEGTEETEDSEEEYKSAGQMKARELQVIEPWLEGVRPVDSEQTPALCSAMEMLSFENFCGAAAETADQFVTGRLGPPDPNFRVVNSLSDQYGLPREISCHNRGNNKNKSSNRPTRQRTFRQEVEFMNSHEPESSLMKVLRSATGRGGGRKNNTKRTSSGGSDGEPKTNSSTTVHKVKIFMEKPPPRALVHSHSVESNITLPPELCESMLADFNCHDVAEFGPLCSTRH